MKTLLAIETSTRACSVALSVGDQIHILEEMTPQAHAKRLLPMVDSLMKKQGIEPEQLDGLVFGQGPGAFTGLRIAASVIQGLALGWNKPVAGVSGLEAMAWWYSRSVQQPVLAALDARMGECYVSIYHQGAQNVPASLVSPEQVIEWIDHHGVAQGVGDALEQFPILQQHLTQWQYQLPTAQHLIKLAQSQGVPFRSLEEALPMPMYLRNQVADKPKGR